MKDLEITAKIKICNHNELTIEQKNVVKAAEEATLRAYAPYSNYHVGAAVLLDNGEIISGSNQENAAYPSGICAERTTLFYAGSQYPDAKILKLAICARSNGEITKAVCAPCGACRQVISELMDQDSLVTMTNLKGDVKTVKVKELLPFVFTEGDLNV